MIFRWRGTFSLDLSSSWLKQVETHGPNKHANEPPIQATNSWEAVLLFFPYLGPKKVNLLFSGSKQTSHVPEAVLVWSAFSNQSDCPIWRGGLRFAQSRGRVRRGTLPVEGGRPSLDLRAASRVDLKLWGITLGYQLRRTFSARVQGTQVSSCTLRGLAVAAQATSFFSKEA